MSAILLIIPKNNPSEGEVDFSNYKSALQNRVKNYFGANVEDPIWINPPNVSTQPLLAYWRSRSSSPDLYHESDMRWAVGTQGGVSAEILKYLMAQEGRLKVTGPAWGSYMAIHGVGTTDRVVAWSTPSSIEAVHYSNTPQYVYISNRPALIAAAMGVFEERPTELEDNYALEYLQYGFSVGTYTPFESVLTVPARMALQITGGVVGFIPVPSVSDFELEREEVPFRTGSTELLQALENAVDRLIASRSSNDVQLRLSGGIDSRILLGLLRNYSQLNITAVTHGDADSEEVGVAAELASLAGVNHIVCSPRLVDQTGGYESMVAAIAEGQGFIPSEALTAPYSSADTRVVGENLAAGQWPVFKGVYERIAKTTHQTTTDFLQTIESGLLADHARDRASDSIRQWLAITPAMFPREVLYLYGRDIRASKYLQPEAVRIDRTALPFYPFLDSEVVAVADRLPEVNRRSQFTSFFALERLWPEALRVPQARGGRFRFEKNGPFEGISGEFYNERTATPRSYKGAVENLFDVGALSSPEFFSSPRTYAANLIKGSSFWAQKSEWFNPEFRGLVDTFAQAGNDRHLADQLRTRASRKRILLDFWRVLLVVIWYEGAWLVA